MRQLLFLLLFMPALLSAQEDAPYLAGAVPVVDGKVVFSGEIQAPSLSKNQIYDRILNWADGYFNKEKSRVVYTNKENGDIAAAGDEYITFSSTALSLDRSFISYKLTIKCRDHFCSIKMANIRYTYGVSYQREPEKYVAEKWITDKYALNKSLTKLNRISGKFRRQTVDLAGDLFKQAALALGTLPAATAVQAATVTSAAQTTPALQLVPATTIATTEKTTKEGFVSFDINKIPNTILQMLPQSPLSVAPEKDALLIDNDIQWKGLGNMFGKSIASISFPQGSTCYKTIENNDVYSISFLKEEGGNKDSWMIIECRKQGETPDGNRTTVIGEVLNIWIK